LCTQVEQDDFDRADVAFDLFNQILYCAIFDCVQQDTGGCA
jgi:hypothetical protein